MIPVAFLIQLTAGLDTKMFQLTMPNVRPYRVNIKLQAELQTGFRRCETCFHMLRCETFILKSKIAGKVSAN